MSSSQLRRELDACVASNVALTKENEELRQEVVRLKSQLSSLKARDHGRKSLLWKKIQNSIDSDHANATFHPKKPSPETDSLDISKLEEDQKQNQEAIIPDRQKKPPPPPPPPPPPIKPAAASFCHSSLRVRVMEMNNELIKIASPAPAPPPPPPMKSLQPPAAGRRDSVRRVPQVVDFYRSLTTRKDHNQVQQQMDSKSNAIGGVVPLISTFNKNMIGEIENRSTYLSAIKSEVESQGRFINFLIQKVEYAAFSEISDVETFVKWLDDELSSLVDERAVLKHFPEWPERKADAMREAAFSYRELKNLESQVTSFRDDPKADPLTQLARIQGVQDRLERSISNIERTRETTAKKYRDLQIPWKWMLETGLIGQMKLNSLKLAKEYMKRVVRQLSTSNSTVECHSVDRESLLLQGVRFAFRVHQFVGGFDEEAIRVFDELKKARQGKH